MQSSLVDEVLKEEISSSNAIEQYGKAAYENCLASIQIADCYMELVESFIPKTQQKFVLFAKFHLSELKNFEDLVFKETDRESIRDLVMKSWSINHFEKIEKKLRMQQLLLENDREKRQRKLDFYVSVLEKRKYDFPLFSYSGFGFIYIKQDCAKIELFGKDFDNADFSYEFEISFEELRTLFSYLTFQCVKVSIR